MKLSRIALPVMIALAVCGAVYCSKVAWLVHQGQAANIILQVSGSDLASFAPSDRVKALKGICARLRQTLSALPGGEDVRVDMLQDDRLAVRMPRSLYDAIDARKSELQEPHNSPYVGVYYLDNVRSAADLSREWRVRSESGGDGETYVFTGPGGRTVASTDTTALMREVIGDRQPILAGRDILASSSSCEGSIVIEFSLEGEAKFRDFTSHHTRDCIAFFLGDQLLTVALISEQISDGVCVVTGFRSADTASRVNDLIVSGTQLVALKQVAVRILD